MSDPCCDQIIGGKIYLRIGAKRYEGMGDATIITGDVERTAGATSGGRLWVTERAEPARVQITYANLCDSNPQEIFDARCHVNLTIVEESRGFKHLVTKGAVVGRPSFNLATGEVSGIEIATTHYKKLNN
jgi:hypothetical protein